MSIFAFYFTVQLLREAGWPRKLGRFKGDGYDAVIADLAFAQSIDWGAALGAGRPQLALQMIAEMFRDRDWESDDAPDVKVFVDGAPEAGWSTADSPQDAVKPLQFATGMATISVEQFNDPQLRTTTEQLLLQALLWGLSNPDRFEAWYGSMLAHRESMLPMMQAAGVQTDLPSLQDFFESSTQIIGDYERDIGPLPSIPRRLLDDAAALGWKVSDTQQAVDVGAALETGVDERDHQAAFAAIQDLAGAIPSIETTGDGSELDAQAVTMIHKYIAVMHVWEKAPLSEGFDCSGLVQMIWKQLGVEVPRTTAEQWEDGMSVSLGDLKPGDALFFGSADSQARPTNVGLYVGENKFIEAPGSGAIVKISTLGGRADYLGARRFL